MTLIPLPQNADKCWFYSDESGNLKVNRFFAIGVLGTHHPGEVEKILKEIRKQTNFYGEISYKSSDDRRALCGLRWMDWFFSEQELIKFRLVLKDKETFNVGYFKDNHFGANPAQLAYCESYKEVLKNFAGFEPYRKILTYNQINLKKLKVDEYVSARVTNLALADCFSGSATEKRPHKDEFNTSSELLQFADLLTSTLRGLCASQYGEDGENKSWVRKMWQLNWLYHRPDLKESLLNWKNYYLPTYQPFESQKVSIYCWRPRNNQNTPSLRK